MQHSDKKIQNNLLCLFHSGVLFRLHVYVWDPLSRKHVVDLIHIFRSWFPADQQLVAVTRKDVSQYKKNKHYELANMGVNS